MGLTGQLDDLPLLDMLQIIAFSKKSGYLRVFGTLGRGAVLLKEGRVLFSYSWSTVEKMRKLAADPSHITPEVMREYIEASLRELGGLREGSFRFDLSDSISEDWGQMKFKPLLLEQGLDPQELLLELAVELDDDRRDAASPIELACRLSSAVSAASPEGEDERQDEALEPGAGTSVPDSNPIQTESSADHTTRSEYLRMMTRRLFEPRGTRDVSGLVLDAAQRFIERGILFVVKGKVAKGIAGYGIAREPRACSALVQRIVLDVETCPPVAEVVESGNTISTTGQLEILSGPVYSVVEKAHANDAVLLPLLYNGATLLFLFGDNGATGAPIGDISRLELFFAQAGMALENKYLHQKLRRPPSSE